MKLLIALLLFTTLLRAQQPVLEPRPPDFKPSPVCHDHQHFHSAALNRDMGYCILLPADYASAQRDYPVLYLLHGLWGSENDWLASTNLRNYAHAIPLVIVMPEGDDGWYTNWQSDPAARYEDYLTTDLPREIAAKYRISTDRTHTFIAGLSMGGYGAMKAALKHPDRYAAVGAFSSPFAITRQSGDGFRTPTLAFGPGNSPDRPANDDLLLAAHSDPAALPYLFITCGTNDFLLNENNQMLQVLHLIRARYEYHETPGAHEWPFWDRSIQLFLERLTPH